MEIIKVQSGHSLLTSGTADEAEGGHSYYVNCRQYLSAYKKWEQSSPKAEGFAVMTLESRQIWITANESEKIADAIYAAQSPVIMAEHDAPGETM